MTTDQNQPENKVEGANDNVTDGPAPPRVLTEAAKRALAEAEERRRQAVETEPAPEQGGRGGKDPSRFGDWEIKGRAIDF